MPTMFLLRGECWRNQSPGPHFRISTASAMCSGWWIEEWCSNQNNEHLFHIVTPINIYRLESLLVNHPNPPFVASILWGLREGFWLWVDTARSLSHNKGLFQTLWVWRTHQMLSPSAVRRRNQSQPFLRVLQPRPIAWHVCHAHPHYP